MKVILHEYRVLLWFSVDGENYNIECQKFLYEKLNKLFTKKYLLSLNLFKKNFLNHTVIIQQQ